MGVHIVSVLYKTSKISVVPKYKLVSAYLAYRLAKGALVVANPRPVDIYLAPPYEISPTKELAYV